MGKSNIILISGKSGSGKDAVINGLKEKLEGLYPGQVKGSEYYVTRKPRSNEKISDRFKSPEEFTKMQKDGKILFVGNIDDGFNEYKAGHKPSTFNQDGIVIINIASNYIEDVKKFVKCGKVFSVFLWSDEQNSIN